MARDFNAAEDRAIILAYEELECDWPAIGAALNRPFKSVKSRYRLLLDSLNKADFEALRTGPAPTVPRDCLRCEQTFDSYGCGHRLCDSCSVANGRVWTFDRTIHVAPTLARRGVDAPTTPTRPPIGRQMVDARIAA